MSDLRERIAETICDHMSNGNDTLATLTEYRRADMFGAATAVLALLPPAPDGTTEGSWRLVPVEPGTCHNDDSGWLLEFMRVLHGNVPEGEQPKAWMDFSGPQVERIQAAWRALTASFSDAPSVSPVGPKGEEDQGLMASRDHAPTVSAVREGAHPGGWITRSGEWARPGDMGRGSPAPTDFHQWVRLAYRDANESDHFTYWQMEVAFAAGRNIETLGTTSLPNPPASVSPLGEGKPPSVAPSEQNPSSQPSQTGEENAGLVEDAATDVEALEKQATRIIFEAMPRPECCQPGCTITPGVHPDCGCYMDAAIIAYDLRHLLAPRSPIPGEGRGRDAAEALSEAYFVVTGRSPHWSATFGVDEALTDITDACDMLRLAARTKLGLGK